MSIKEKIITREIATQLLNLNTNNRPMTVRRVNHLAAIMQRGEWKYNGDSIRISKTGRLLDGQHRLSAIEKTGIPQKYVVIDDLDDDAFTTIDVGSKRSAANMVSIAGHKNVTIMASVANMVLTMQMHGRPVHGSHDKKPTQKNIVDFCDGNDDLDDSCTYVNRKWIKRYVSPGVAGFCHYQFGKFDSQLRDDFFHELETGEFSYSNSPIKFMREMMIEERGQLSKPDKTRRIAMMFKAFRLYSKRKPAKIVRLEKNIEGWFSL